MVRAQSGADYVVLESAILFEAGLEGYVDRTIAVTAPIDVRIARTCCVTGLRPRRCDAVSRSSSTKRSCVGGPTIPLSI